MFREDTKWTFEYFDPAFRRYLDQLPDPTPLGELITEIRYGASLSPDYSETGTLFIRAQNIRDYGIDLSDVRHIPRNGPDIERYRLKAGDLLITRSGINVGDAAVIPPELEGCIHGSYSIKIRLDRTRISPEYAAVVLNSEIGQCQIAVARSRSAQPNINVAELRALTIPLLSRFTQDRIAAIMREAYATRRAMLAEAEDLLGGIDDYVLEELGIELTQIPDEKRFVVNAGELLGHRFEVDYHLPRLKARYRAIRNGLYPVFELGSLILEMSGGATPLGARYLDEGIPFLRIQNITESGIDLSDVRYISEETHQQMKRSQTRPGDLLITITGRVGTAVVVPPGLPEANTNQHMVIIRLANNQVSPHYLATVINSSIVAFQAQHKTTGTTRVALDYKSIRSLLVPVPPLEVQEALVLAVQDRQRQAEHLRVKAQEIVSEAKERVERIILGEEDVG
jgi:restriction endonuclease S subunit